MIYIWLLWSLRSLESGFHVLRLRNFSSAIAAMTWKPALNHVKQNSCKCVNAKTGWIKTPSFSSLLSLTRSLKRKKKTAAIPFSPALSFYTQFKFVMLCYQNTKSSFLSHPFVKSVVAKSCSNIQRIQFGWSGLQLFWSLLDFKTTFNLLTL